MEYLIFGISLGLFIVGLIAALLGFLSRREQPTGHLGWCRSCRHPVRAETSHCSECGGDLSGPKAVRSTLPRVRSCLVTAGVLGILLGLGGISGERVAALQGFDWNTVKPVWWLELQAAGGTGVNTENVRKELVRRYMDGELTSGQATDCARASLDRFITRKPWGSPGDATLLEYAWLDDFLSDDEMKKFFQSNWDRYAEVKIRDRVRIGQAIPFRLQLLETGLPWNISARRMPHAISIQASFKAVRDVEGEDLLQSPMGSTTFGGWFLGGLPSSYGTSFALPLSEGMNHLAVEVDFTLILSPGTSFLTGKDIGGERFTWTHVYPVSLNAAPDDQPVVNAVAVEAFQETLREAVFMDFENGTAKIPEGHSLNHDEHVGFVGIRKVPVAVAFSVFLRHDGKEELAGMVTRPFDSTQPVTGGLLFSENLANLPKGTREIDVILRSDVALAERTDSLMDTMAIWEGELVFEDVPVSRYPLDRDDKD